MFASKRRFAALVWIALTVPPLAVAGSVDLPVQVGGGYHVPVSSLKEGKFLATVRQQYDFSCGSAALSTLLTYQYDYPVSETVTFTEMFEHGDQEKIKREGFSLLDLKVFLERHGFTADGFEAPLDKLASANIPAVVLLKENGYSHFVVVKGVRDGRVLIGDPAGGTRVMSRAHFESLWMNQILFVISNKRELARFNASVDWNVAPLSPLASGVNRDGIAGTLLFKMGPSDF